MGPSFPCFFFFSPQFGSTSFKQLGAIYSIFQWDWQNRPNCRCWPTSPEVAHCKPKPLAVLFWDNDIVFEFDSLCLCVFLPVQNNQKSYSLIKNSKLILTTKFKKKKAAGDSCSKVQNIFQCIVKMHSITADLGKGKYPRIFGNI